jgi:capsid protein
LILTLVGINLGMPFCMLVLDASETNFSGWRGAIDQARMGFMRNQRILVRRFLTPVYRWRARRFADQDRTARRLRAKWGEPSYFAHRWGAPRWPSIQPKDDETADGMALANGTASPRRLNARKGQEYEDVLAERIADNEAAIQRAIEAAARIEAATGQTVDPMTILFLGRDSAKAQTPIEIRVPASEERPA